MIYIGVPKEIKNHEYRVGLTPSSVKNLIIEGNQVLVEQGAGIGSGFLDSDYISAGAEIIENPSKIFQKSNMIIKVKEPQENELKMQLNDGNASFIGN